MKVRHHLFTRIAAALLNMCLLASASAQGTPLTAFTYQGRLSNSSGGVGTPVDLRFTLHDQASGGTNLGTAASPNVTPDGGLFAATLDFGVSPFGGPPRWLEIAVRPAGSGSYTVLTPRQPLTPAPFSLQTRGMTVESDSTVRMGTSTSPVLDQSNISTVSGGNFGLFNWQSFTPTISSYLTRATIGIITTQTTTATLTVRAGEGANGAVLASAQIDLPAGVNAQVPFDIPSPPAIISGTKYTLRLDFSNAFVALHRSSNTYSGGQCWWGASFDLSFQTFMSVTRPTLVVKADGRVGIGTSAPTEHLSVDPGGPGGMVIGGPNPTGGDRTCMWLTVSDLSNGYCAIQSIASSGTQYGHLILNPAGVGNVGIGTTTPDSRLTVNGTASKPGGGSWATFSDARLKHDVTPLEGSLDRLLQLRGVSFIYNDPRAINEPPGRRVGMVAQEVERVFPEWVETGASGYKMLTFSGFEALTVESLRELKAENARLRRELEARDSEMASLRVRTDQIQSIVNRLAEEKGE